MGKNVYFGNHIDRVDGSGTFGEIDVSGDCIDEIDAFDVSIVAI